MTTKKEMTETIQEAVSQDETFGNKIVDCADAWRDAITEVLRKTRKKYLKSLYEDAKEIVKPPFSDQEADGTKVEL
jgi:hypothetical protein